MLLAEIDRLAYPERMSLLAGRARALAASGDLDSVVSDLYRGERFQREMAVFMAIVAGHQPTIEAALADPVWNIHRTAVNAWLRSGLVPAGAIAAFVAEASWHTRRHVYRQLRRFQAPTVADEVIEAVWDRFGDGEAARLLPACSAGAMTRLLPELGYAAGDWSLLGKLHPEVVVNVAESQLAELTVPDRARWWGRFGTGVIAAGSALPLRVSEPAGALCPLGEPARRVEPLRRARRGRRRPAA